MAQTKLQSVMQTENAGLFSICFEGESYNEFEKFILKYEELHNLSECFEASA